MGRRKDKDVEAAAPPPINSVKYVFDDLMGTEAQPEEQDPMVKAVVLHALVLEVGFQKIADAIRDTQDAT